MCETTGNCLIIHECFFGDVFQLEFDYNLNSSKSSFIEKVLILSFQREKNLKVRDKVSIEPKNFSKNYRLARHKNFERKGIMNH